MPVGLPYNNNNPRPVKNGQPPPCIGQCNLGIGGRKVGAAMKRLPQLYYGDKAKEQILQKWDTATNSLVTIRGPVPVPDGPRIPPPDTALPPATVTSTDLWSKFRGNNQNTGLSNYIGSQTNDITFVYPTGGPINSSPVIGSDGTIYVGSQDKDLYALDKFGVLKWRYTTGGSVTSSPAIGSDGTIYINDDSGTLYAINTNGTLKWSYVIGPISSSSSAIASDGTIYIGSNDKNIYALTSSGRLKWRYTTGASITSSPAIGSDGTIYIGSLDNNLYAINTNGTLKWRYTTMGPLGQSPAIGSDGTIYISYNNTLAGINPNGTLKSAFNTVSAVKSSPAIGSDGTIYVGSFDDNLYAIGVDGNLVWQYDSGNIILSSPAIGSDGTIYFGTSDKVLAIQSTGSLLWEFQVGTYITASPAIAPDGTIYVGSLDNNLYAINGLYINKGLYINTLIGEGGTYTTPIRDSSSDLDYFNNNVYYQTADNVLSARNIVTGALTVVAGNGTYGLPENGSVPSLSVLPIIYRFHVNSSGNIYIAVGFITPLANNSQFIFMIPRQSGIYFNVPMVANRIYRIAGGPFGNDSPREGLALNSSFQVIVSITTDYQGNLFISNTIGANTNGSQCITMMPAANGTFFGRNMIVGNIYVLTYNSTVPGENSSDFTGYNKLATAARLNSVQGLITDSLGNLILADSFHVRIAMITRVAGRYFGVNMPNVGFIYLIAGDGIGDYTGDGVPAVNTSLRVPRDMLLDSYGNLIFSDSYNNRIRNISPSGYISTVAGNSPSGLSAGSFGGDGGLATDAQLRRPYGLALKDSNTIYVLDEGNNRIRVLYQ